MKKSFHQNKSKRLLESFWKRIVFTHRYFIQKLPTLRFLLLSATVFIIVAFFLACGGGGGSNVNEDNSYELITIDYPTTYTRITEYCDSVTIGGEVHFNPPGNWASTDPIFVNWENKTTGDSDDVQCPFIDCDDITCNYTWEASVPLAVEDNFIVVHFTDPSGNYGSDSLTVTKPDVSTNTISGRVVATNGEPLGFSAPNIEMHLKGEDIESYAEMDSDGSYSFTCIPDGLYTITISSAVSYNYRPESHTVIVSNGDVSGVDFVVETYLITGKVVNTNGVAIGYSYPYIEPHLKGENIESYAVVDSDGSYSFTWIPDGSYTITLASDMDYYYEPQSHTVIVNNEDVSGADFEVKAYFVHGRVDSICPGYLIWN